MKVSWLFVGFLAFAVLPFIACRIQEHRSRERRASNGDGCQSRPCQNNGVGSDAIGVFTCTCADGYSGTFCEKNNQTSLSKRESIVLLVFVVMLVAIIFLAMFVFRLRILNLCKIRRRRRRFRSSPADESSGRQTAVIEEEDARKTGKCVEHDDPVGKSSRNQELSTLSVGGPAGQSIPQTEDHYQELKSLVPEEPKYGTLSPETRLDNGGNSGEGLQAEQTTSQPYNPYQEITTLTPTEPKYGTLSLETRDDGSKASEGLTEHNTSQPYNSYQEIKNSTPAEPKYGTLSLETRDDGSKASEALTEHNTSQPYNPYQEIKNSTPAEPKYGTLSLETRESGNGSVD